MAGRRITPFSLAETCSKAAARRSPEAPSAVTAEPNGAGFFVYDDQGGILKVVVTQYKEPI